MEDDMQRTTIMLPPDLKRRAQQRAYADGISLGELIRRSLESAVAEPQRTRGEDPLFADSQVFTGDAPTDLAGDHDRHLYGDTG
jgi:hypothetical protein